MAFGDRIQTATNTGTSGAANVTFSAATAGNLLVFTITRSAATSAAGDVFSTPSGWANLPAANDSGDNMAAGGWYKIAAGGETSVALDGTNESGNWTAIVNEYEGAFDATPLDVVAEDESNTATAVTSQASGTTATTAQNDELAVAYFGIDNGGNFGTKQYSNSFTEQGVLISGARAGSTQATRVLTATGTYTTTLSYSAGGSADEMYGAIATFKKASSGAYTLDLDAGSYAVTGRDPALTADRSLALDAGSYVITGQDVTLQASRVLDLDAGGYTITGHDVTLTVSRVLALDAGAYTITGQDATLEYSGSTYVLDLDAGGYVITGHDVTLTVDRTLALDAGSYTVTGQDASLLRGFALALDAGSYAITGQDATLVAARVLGLDAGSYSITGRDATLDYSGAAAGSVVALADSALYVVALADSALYGVVLEDSNLYALALGDAAL